MELESVEANVLPPATIDLQLDRSSSAIDIGVPLPEDKNALEVLGKSCSTYSVALHN